MPIYAIIFNDLHLKLKKIDLCCHFHLEITEHITTGGNSATKIITQPFRNNEKIVIHERYNYWQ